MEAIQINETPPAACRRLSVKLRADETEIAADIIMCQESNLSFHHLSDRNDLETTEKVSEENGNDEIHQKPSRKRDSRASIVGRRASGVSRVFALSSTSESFVQKHIRPTLINAMIFFKDPEPNAERLREVLAERLLLIPRFRSIVRMDKNAKIHYDPLPRSSVDFKEHLKVVDGMKTYNAKDIEDMVNDAFSTDWTAERPLWRMTLVTNLADGRSMLFVIIDHAIGDGVGLLAVLLSLFDDPLEGCGDDKLKGYQKARKTPPRLCWSHQTIAFLRGIYDGIIGTLIPSDDTMHSLLIPKDQLKLQCPGKSLAQTRAFPLAEVKAMKNKLSGTTVNDVMLALITMTVRKIMEQSADEALLAKFRKGKARIRGEFPVNMRRGAAALADAATSLGNNICFVTLPFSAAYSDPIDAVWLCKSKVDELKVSPSFILKKVMGDFLSSNLPEFILAETVLQRMNQSTCTISNVIGPSEHATFGGYEIDDLTFTTAYVGGLYFGILSYGGSLRISALLDKRTSSNVETIKQCLEQSYDELKNALKDVDEDAPLKMPNMTPFSARMLEFLVYAAVVAIPVWMATTFQK